MVGTGEQFKIFEEPKPQEKEPFLTEEQESELEKIKEDLLNVFKSGKNIEHAKFSVEFKIREALKCDEGKARLIMLDLWREYHGIGALDKNSAN